jgi:hypothetical protein
MWTCNNCGEQHDHDFDQCWNCGALQGSERGTVPEEQSKLFKKENSLDPIQALKSQYGAWQCSKCTTHNSIRRKTCSNCRKNKPLYLKIEHFLFPLPPLKVTAYSYIALLILISLICIVLLASILPRWCLILAIFLLIIWVIL